MKFKDLPIGTHFRIYSVISAGVVLPSVRVKTSTDRYRMLYRKTAQNRLVDPDLTVAPVPEQERQGGER